MSESTGNLLNIAADVAEPFDSQEAPATGETDETAERFDPTEMRGAVVEAEHLARYRFAAALVNEKTVLDAACGWGYGSNMLAAAGASRVTGIDIADAVVDAARADAEDNVIFETGDIEQLKYADGSFQRVVCFEAIEHVERWEQTLDEFARVLGDDGLLVISTPNDSAYGDRNEHHIHQFEREEFRDELGARFKYVEVFAQSAWIVSMINSHEWYDAEGLESPIPSVLKTVAGGDHGEIYEVAVASNAPLPKINPAATLTLPVEFKDWIERWEAQDQYLTNLQAWTSSLRVDQIAKLSDELIEANERIADSEARLTMARQDLDEIKGSLSWRVTAPLRENSLLRRFTRRSS